MVVEKLFGIVVCIEMVTALGRHDTTSTVEDEVPDERQPELNARECLPRTSTRCSYAHGVDLALVETAQDFSPEPNDCRFESIRGLHPIELNRIATQSSQQAATVGCGRDGNRVKSGTSKSLPPFGANKPYPPQLPDRDAYVVEFDGPDDPLHPQCWPLRKKIFITVILAYTTLTATFSSSIFASVAHIVAHRYGVGDEVGILGTSLYVLGFAFGPPFWAPLSELRGRRLPLLVSMFGFTVFSISTATGKDIQTVLICRFFGGLFAACPVTIVAAVISDMFDARSRGVAITLFAATVFTGPLLAPFVGGFIANSDSLDWRWTEYIASIMGFLAFVLAVLFLEESYAPVILIDKAAELRRSTKNWGIHAKQEEIEVDVKEIVSKNFSRPLRLLFTEPIILLLSIYTSFIYGLLYLLITAYPLVFIDVHGFNPGQSGLTLFGMIVGQFLAAASVIAQQPWYTKKLAENGGTPVPEWRLPSVMVGGISFAVGIFWFGWLVVSSIFGDSKSKIYLFLLTLREKDWI